MTDLKPEDLVKPIEPEKAAAFLEEAARYFSKLPDNGEDQAYWANVYNADNCRRVSALVSSLLADRARMEKAIELLCEVYEAARDVSMAAVQDDDGEWSIKGDPEAMLGRLYLATEEVRKVTKGASQ